MNTREAQGVPATVGPWVIRNISLDHYQEYIIESVDATGLRLIICRLTDDGMRQIMGRCPGEVQANARLIAAAPNLYATARRLLSPVPGDTLDAAIEALKRAVQQADGRRIP